ncbi:MAG: hypothetical protein LBG20_00815 [Holosporaceae bacterium]|jgi:hypothetical protein|nr:hypothetical protein [Holosporaceae bacterium]
MEKLFHYFCSIFLLCGHLAFAELPLDAFLDDSGQFELFSCWGALPPLGDQAPPPPEGQRTHVLPSDCSVFWGALPIHAQYLKKLHQYGNFSIDERNARIPGDGVMQLLVSLFNRQGSFGIRSDTENKFRQADAKEKAIEQVAGLYVKIRLCRALMEKGFIIRANKKTIMIAYGTSNPVPIEKAFASHNWANCIDNQHQIIARALMHEPIYGYEKYFCEQLVLAFVFSVLSDRADLFTFYRKVHRKLTDIGAILSTGNQLSIINKAKELGVTIATPEDLVKLNEGCGSILFSDLRQVADLSIASKMYATAPVSNNRCFRLSLDERQGPIQLDIPFADCVEAAIRHFFNLCIGQKIIDSFSSSSDSDRTERAMTEQLQRVVTTHIANKTGRSVLTEKLVNRIPQLISFYKKYWKDVNDGSIEARTDWNRVVFGLDDVDYCDDNTHNEIKSKYTSIVNAICGVLGLSNNDRNAAMVEILEIASAFIGDGRTITCSSQPASGNDLGRIQFFVKCPASTRDPAGYFILEVRIMHSFVELTPATNAINYARYEGDSFPSLFIGSFLYPGGGIRFSTPLSIWQQMFGFGNVTIAHDPVVYEFLSSRPDTEGRDRWTSILTNVIQNQGGVLKIAKDNSGDIDLRECTVIQNVEIGRAKIDGTFTLPSTVKTVSLLESGEIGTFNLSLCKNVENIFLQGRVVHRLTLSVDDQECLSKLKSFHLALGVSINGGIDLSKCYSSSFILRVGGVRNVQIILSSRQLCLRLEGDWFGGVNIIAPGDLDISQSRDLSYIALNGDIGGNLLVSANLEQMHILSGNIGGTVVVPDGSKLKSFSLARGASIAGDLDLSNCDELEEIRLEGKIAGRVIWPVNLKITYREGGKSAEISGFGSGGFDLSGHPDLLKLRQSGHMGGRLTAPINLKEMDIFGNVGGVDIPRGSQLESFCLAPGASIVGDLDLSECNICEKLWIVGHVMGRLTLPRDLTKVKNLDLSQDMACFVAPSGSLLESFAIDFGVHVSGNIDLSKCKKLWGISLQCKIDGTITVPANLKEICLEEENVNIAAIIAHGNFDISESNKLKKLSIKGEVAGNIILPANLEEMDIQSGNVGGTVVVPDGSKLKSFSLGQGVVLKGNLDLSNCNELTVFLRKGQIEGSVTLPQHLAGQNGP